MPQDETNTAIIGKEKKPNLEELSKQEFDSFHNFYIMVWTPNPNKENVKVILDSGDIQMFLKRDIFLTMLLDLLDINNKEVALSYFHIKRSCYTYGGYFLYDRINNEFRELQEQPNFERIRPLDLINETHKEYIKERMSSNYKELVKRNDDFLKHKIPLSNTLRGSLWQYATVVRNSLSRKKS